MIEPTSTPPLPPAILPLGEMVSRLILTGHVCICGQTWPDAVPTEHAQQVRAECCGALYQLQRGEGQLETLSLLERPAHLGPEVPTPETTFVYDRQG